MKKVMLSVVVMFVVFMATPIATAVEPIIIDGVSYVPYRYVDANGADAEELVRIPEGSTAENFAGTLFPNNAPKMEAEQKNEGFALVVTPVHADNQVVWTVGVSRKFGRFADLFKTNKKVVYYQTAQAVEGIEDSTPKAPREGFFARTGYWIMENPVKSTLIALASVGVADYAMNGDLVGLFGEDSSTGDKSTNENSGSDQTVVSVNGDGNTVNLNIDRGTVNTTAASP